MSNFTPVAVHSFLSQHLKTYLNALEVLVNMDSATNDRDQVDRVGCRVAELMQAWGWTVERRGFRNIGDYVFGSLRGTGEGRLVLLAHLDTVFPAGTATRRPMSIEGNRLLGPGVCDMKAGILTGLWAMRALQVHGIEDFDRLTLWCVSDEEDRSPEGAEFLLENLGAFDAAFVLEAARPDGTIVSSRKGGGKYLLHVYGRSAHAGADFEKGVNAIQELAHQIIAITALNDISAGVTVSVNRVSGGTKFNVIPDFAEAEIDTRASNAHGIQLLGRALQQLPSCTNVPGTRVEMQGFMRPAMPRSQGTAYLVSLAKHAAEQLGFSLDEGPTSGGTSDANYAAAAGIPVLDGLGPVGGNDHTVDEYVELESIVPRTAMLAMLLRDASRNVQVVRELVGAASSDSI